ncbi:MAG: sialidase [Acidobacteria bacterium]|nr:sialidase [Acidobacteriota bacterium]
MSSRYGRLLLTLCALVTMSVAMFAIPITPSLDTAAAVASAAALSDGEVFQGRGGGGGGAQIQAVDPLKFRYMGPAPAGRVASVVGVPGDPTTYYLGNASGGIWKSTDSGATFVPVFDDMPVQAIGALALSSSDHNQVWAGTGEGWVIRPSDVMGDGVYKSMDAGATWTHMGLRDTGRIGRVIVHPTDPNIVYVCAVGRTTGSQQERGVFKTVDGGKSWTHSLFVNQNTGCSGLSMDSKNSNILIAGSWQLMQRTWQQYSGGPGSAVYITKDAGATWKKIENGMPRSPVGKIDVAIAPSDSNRMYALIQTADQGSLWRSDDGGTSFNVVSWDRSLIGRAGYYIRLGVNPQDPNDVIVMNSGFHRSKDGGKLFPISGGCGDCHDVWFDPTDGTRYVLTDDGGATIFTSAGSRGVRLPNGQMYHVAVDNRVPYWIYSNRQDDGTMRGPSTSPEQTGNGRIGGSEPAAPAAAPGRGGGGGGGGRGGRAGGPAWDTYLGGCESGFTQPQPDNADIVWGSCYGNKLTRFDARQGTARSVSPSMITFDSAPNLSKHRCHWTAPVAFDAFEPTTVYYGCEVIFKTSNEGQSWVEISPDLSTRDPRLIVASGGVVQDNLGQFAGATVYAIASSPRERGLLWAGTNDGKVWYTRNGGGNWVDVSANLKGMPDLGTITQIWPSTFDAASAIVTVDGHVNDNRRPYIFKTTDYGATWSSVVGDLPTGHSLDYVLSTIENSNRPGMLFAGTGRAFYYSMDNGVHWTRFKEGLPASPVTWVVYEPRYHDVVLSTYGRGLFILPDITVLEQTGQPTAPPATKLFTPRAGFRQARAGSADFIFSLAAAPTGPVKMEILNSVGEVIWTQSIAGGRAGLNRVSWDLQYEPAKMVEIRTTPRENQYIWEEPDFSGKEVRMVMHWGISATTGTPIAAPGKYSVRVTLNGQSFTEPFEVLKDPAIKASNADLIESTAMQIRIRDAISSTSGVVNQLEITRKQIEDLLKQNRGKDEIEKPLMDLDTVLFGTELRLVTRQDLRSDDKYFADAYKVYMNLLWLGGAVGLGAGDEAGAADYKPRDVAYDILVDQLQQLADAQAAFDRHIAVDVPAFNKTMAGKISAIRIAR